MFSMPRPGKYLYICGIPNWNMSGIVEYVDIALRIVSIGLTAKGLADSRKDTNKKKNRNRAIEYESAPSPFGLNVAGLPR